MHVYPKAFNAFIYLKVKNWMYMYRYCITYGWRHFMVHPVVIRKENKELWRMPLSMK